MSRKRKHAEKQQRLDNRLAEEKRLKALVADAEKIEDPAEKIVKLEDILKDVTGVINKEEKQIRYQGSEAGANTIMGGGGSAVAMLLGGFATVIIAPPAAPVGLGMMASSISAVIASIPVALRREKAVKKNLAAEAEDHLQTMKDLQQSVTGAKDTLITYIKAHKDEIVHSQFYEQASKLPDLSEAFEGVAAQQFAKYKEAAEAAREIADMAKPKEPEKMRSRPIPSPLTMSRRPS
jgi:hypothetical protein